MFQQKEEPSQQEKNSPEISGLEWGGKKVQNAQQVYFLIKVLLPTCSRTLMHILFITYLRSSVNELRYSTELRFPKKETPRIFSTLLDW